MLLGIVLQEVPVPDWILMFVTVVLVPILAQLIKLIASKIGKPISRSWVSVVVALVSVVLSWLVVKPVLPIYEDPMEFVSELLIIATSVMGVATFLYNIILAKLFELIGFITPEKKAELVEGKCK